MRRDDEMGPLLDAVAAAPEGPTVAAFVDLDDALLSSDPLGPWLGPDGTLDQVGSALLSAVGAGSPGPGVTARVDRVVAGWAGRTTDEVAEESSSAFRSRTAASIRTEVWRLVRAHHHRGHTVVLTSAATRFQLDPVAAELEADEVHGTHVEVVDGTLTGARHGPVLVGEVRADVVRKIAADRGVDLSRSFAYCARDGDRAVLDVVGHPVLVVPETAGPSAAVPVIHAPDRGTARGPAEWASTLGFYGGFFAGAGAGVGVGLLRGSRFQAWTRTCELAADLGLGLAGIDVEARGVEHMWEQRPAVFIFNHMGLIDAIVAMKLIQGGFTGVAKAETKNWPVFGQLFQLADVAFVDRAGGSPEEARAALEPAVDKLRSGVSLALAPEGTRSPTPTPGRFKKGAFHMAMQAGVPVVPIVLHNSGEVMWRKDVTMRPGTIRVDVLPPIDTTTWTADTLDEHVEHVRSLFVDTLDSPRR